MVALKTSEADSFIARPDSARPIVLIYGPDAGLVRERAEALIRVSVDNPDDVFSLIRIDGEELSGNPFRLVEEANTIPMFGGRRALWVKAGSRNIANAVEAVINAPSPDCRVVIEAGELRKTSPLRTMCEKAKNVAVIACYADEERDVARVVDDELRKAGLAIAPDARAALLPFLGGDRRATRGEVQKLALYVHGRDRITLEDVMAVVADASAVALDNVIDAAFAGKPADVESHFVKARGEGTAPGAIVSAALRHLSSLHRMRIAVEDGQSTTSAVESARPPIHFRRKPAIDAALRVWTAAKLADAMQALGDALLQTRLQPNLAEAIAQRSLLTLATAARKKA
ncbi:DNA polymerase III subunit delta [Pseudorhodoplanes sp.]|uniref:DNA polymerase III subunit delta n=1 Tax=Pseudorhodoplanes sp. TaxID=1934341 RepID=UPI002C1DA251|nr:DNA polymerase III subunit delta [Pseudorhodoplanes sp.]HWV53074.1 DNA polymerase III subunit delta [Pseudorhodoplanes sp.]